MNHGQLLKMSIQEDKGTDERDKEIEVKANSNAYSLIMVVSVLLSVIAAIQEFLTDSSFADYSVLILPFLLGCVGHNWTKYGFYKAKKYMVYTIISVIASAAALTGIIVGAY